MAQIVGISGSLAAISLALALPSTHSNATLTLVLLLPAAFAIVCLALDRQETPIRAAACAVLPGLLPVAIWALMWPGPDADTFTILLALSISTLSFYVAALTGALLAGYGFARARRTVLYR